MIILLPQSTCVRTTRRTHRVKQGVARVAKAKVKRMFVMPDKQVKQENDLTQEQKKVFGQKIMDVFLVPLGYDAVLRDLQREREVAK